MMRLVVAAAAVTALAVMTVSAQQDPIAARKAVMKGVGDQAKIGNAMAKGEAPFDLAKAKQVFATYADAAAKMPSLFPPNTKTGGDTAAAPKIWESKADFDAKFTKFGQDAHAAEAALKDAASFKAQFGDVMKNCGGCHESYRLKKS